MTPEYLTGRSSLSRDLCESERASSAHGFSESGVAASGKIFEVRRIEISAIFALKAMGGGFGYGMAIEIEGI